MSDQKHDKTDMNDGFIDISSSTQVFKAFRSDDADEKSGKKDRRRSGLAKRIIALVLSVIFLISGAVVVYLYTRMPKYKALTVIPAPTTVTGETTVTVEQGEASLLQHDEVLNILLFGQDYRDSADDYGRSDTMILMSINNLDKKIRLTSFQRDTYVNIPGIGDDKINAAFSMGGEALSIRTIESNFGIKVDKYATVDFSSFRKIIDVLGGIDIELNLEEIEYINAQIDVNHQLNRTSFLEYDKTKELQMMHLDGYQALWYARDRGEENLGGNPAYSFSGDDWDRTQRQRKLIETIIKYLRTKASIGELIAVVNEIGPLITTNLKKNDILFLASNIMTYLGYDMEQLTLPSEDTWRYGHTDDGQSVIVIDNWDKARYDLASFIYGSSLVGATEAPSTNQH